MRVAVGTGAAAASAAVVGTGWPALDAALLTGAVIAAAIDGSPVRRLAAALLFTRPEPPSR